MKIKFTRWWMGVPGVNGITAKAAKCRINLRKDAGPCLPSLLRREKMPGYANKQKAPAPNILSDV
jgi:hypothetical protein